MEDENNRNVDREERLDSSDDEQSAGDNIGSARIVFSDGGSSSLRSLLDMLLLANGSASIQGTRVSMDDLRALLVPNDANAPSEEDGDHDEEEEEEEIYTRGGGPPDGSSNWFPQPTYPQDAGVALLKSGEFGHVKSRMRPSNPPLNLARAIQNIPMHARPRLYREDLARDLVPNSSGCSVAMYPSNIYTGQFSTDSSFYYTCSQDFSLHIFDTTAPPLPNSASRGETPRRRGRDPSLETTMKLKRRIDAAPGRWTITDANLSPGNERMVYSSITSTAYLTSTTEESPAQIPIPFGDPPRTRASNAWADAWGYRDNFGIWSCRFSADGNEIVAGGSGKIFVYDLLANRRSVRIDAHKDDVNSCCWADTASGNVLVSASDDSFLKVWDRRSLGSSQKPSGVLVGHTEGITYVSAKGDGRYVISNGKDQALRLWDLRKMRSNAEFETIEDKYYGHGNFDYRDTRYPKPKFKAHPRDCSVMTYRGHSVLRTLIRCHFSPAETTGGQYIYSGSADGKIHIWSLDGRVAQVLNRKDTLPMSFDPSGPEYPLDGGPGMRHPVCVRDVSWHTQQPVLLSAGWDTGGGSVVARHEWKGLSKLPGGLEDWVERSRQEAAENPHSRPRRTTRSMPDYAAGIEEDDDTSDSDYVPPSAS